MNRDLVQLRKNLAAVCPTLTPDDLALVIECLGYELLSRAIWQGTKLVEVSHDLLGWTPRNPRAPEPLRGLPLRQPV